MGLLLRPGAYQSHHRANRREFRISRALSTSFASVQTILSRCFFNSKLSVPGLKQSNLLLYTAKTTDGDPSKIPRPYRIFKIHLTISKLEGQRPSKLSQRPRTTIGFVILDNHVACDVILMLVRPRRAIRICLISSRDEVRLVRTARKARYLLCFGQQLTGFEELGRYTPGVIHLPRGTVTKSISSPLFGHCAMD